MKSIKIVLIVVLSVVVVGLCALLGFVLSGGMQWNGQDRPFLPNYSLVLEKEFSPEELNMIDVDYSRNSNDVRVYESAGDKIVIKEYANYEMPEDEKTTITENGGALEIKGKRRGFLGIHLFYFGRGDGYAEVYLPENYSGSLKICTASGDTAISSDLSLEGDLFVTVASGDIEMKNVTAREIGLTSASGEIEVQKLTAQDINVKTASGEVEVGEVNGRWHCTTASGSVEVSGGSAQGKVKTASGEVQMSLAELTGNFSVTTASGEVYLKLPENASFDFEADTASGEIDTFFENELHFSKRGDQAEGVVNGGNTGFSVDIRTASGDIEILKY